MDGILKAKERGGEVWQEEILNTWTIKCVEREARAGC